MSHDFYRLVSEILALGQSGEVAAAIRKLIDEKSSRRGRLIGLYRDILFLEMKALGREHIDLGTSLLFFALLAKF